MREHLEIKKFFSIKQISVIIPSVILILISLTIFLPNKQNKTYPIILSDLYEQTWFTTKQFGKPCFQRKKKIFCSYDQNNNDKTIFLVGDSIMASMQEQVKK